MQKDKSHRTQQRPNVSSPKMGNCRHILTLFLTCNPHVQIDIDMKDTEIMMELDYITRIAFISSVRFTSFSEREQFNVCTKLSYSFEKDSLT